MSRILVIAEHDGETLNAATARAVRCAQGIEGGTVEIAVLAAAPAAIAAEAARLSGVARVLAIARPENSPYLAAIWAPQIAAIARDYSHVLAPGSTFGKDLLPRVAALAGVAQLSDVMAVEGPYRFRRPIYAGNAIVTVEANPARLLIATVRTASFAAAEAGGEAEIAELATAAELPTHTRFLGAESGDRAGPDLQTAARVVSGGRALGSRENFALIEALASSLRAAVGGSRAAVDSGYVANDRQVGQTGKIIAPDLYIAVGISGAIQHLTGIKDAGTIVAINRDPDAPIFKIADLGLVTDLFTALPELKQRLDERRGGG
jgi:electron transfer flavoprotein alpha subunit